METNTFVVAMIVIAAIAIVGFLFWKQSRSREIRTRFGPEYDRVVQAEGSPARAEAVLMKRQQTVAKYKIRRLTQEERAECAGEWRAVQERFVDDPRQAVVKADELVNRALRARGFPAGDFERQADDISVEHPAVVEHYRAAHRLGLANSATTEDLRSAMKHYRSLMEDLLSTTLGQLEGKTNAKASI